MGGLRREMKCFKCVITWQRFIFEKTGLFFVYILNHGSGSFIFDGKNFWWWWWSSIIKETLSLQLLLCARKFTFCEFYWKRTFILLPKWRKLAKGGGGVGTLLLLTASAWGYKVVYYSSTVPSFVSQKIEQCYSSRESKVTQNLFFLLLNWN